MPPDAPPPEPCLIYHFTKVANLPGILAAGGLACKAQVTPVQDISHAHIQARRARRRVEAGPGGTLHDYVPFYFTPKSPMLHALSKGGDALSDIVYLVSSVERVCELSLPFAFTDGHAEMRLDVHYYDAPADLRRLDWPVLQASGWNGDEERRKRQSEFLIHGFAPLAVMVGFATKTPAARARVQTILAAHGSGLRGRVRPDWYY